MAGSEDNNGAIDAKSPADGPQLALKALTASKQTATSFHWADIPRPPELKSDRRTQGIDSNRGTGQSTATWASSFSSVFSDTRSGVASAATSAPNSTDLDPIFKRRELGGGVVPETSRFSTFTIGTVDDQEVDKHDAFTSKGAVYKLVQATAQTGILWGVVDVYRKEVVDEKWTTFRTSLVKSLYRMIKNPERCIEVRLQCARQEGARITDTRQEHLQRQRENAFKALLPPDPRDTIAKIIITTPASSPRPSETHQSTGHSPNALSPPQSPENLNRTRQYSVSSTIASYHSAISGCDRPSSASSHVAPQHSSRPGHAMRPSIASVFDRAETENGNSISELPESPIDIGTSAPWKQRKSWNSVKSAETHNSAEGEVVETDNDPFLIDIRIFHPSREIKTEVIALCDPQSSHSHISPTALEELGIPLTDTELIKKTEYIYRTNDGALVNPRGKIDLTWRAFTSDGRGRNHTNTFFIAGDDAPYHGVLLGKDHLLPKNGPARMSYNTCLVTIRERKTAEQKEKAEQARREERRRIKENEKLKKEQMAAAAAAAHAQQSPR